MVADGRAYDAFIVGSGPAGASAAIVLAREGWRVCLLHKSAPRPRTGETLPAASRATLGALGVWSAFLQDGHLPSPGTVAWWDGDEPIEQDSVFDPSGPAWHVDRERFDRRLRDAAIAHGADMVEDARLVDAHAAQTWNATLARDGRLSTYTARVLILATGRARPAVPGGIVRRRLDRLIGLAAVTSARPATDSGDQRIWIEATPAGWWYSAPMRDGAWTFTFFTDADEVPLRDGRNGVTRYWQHQLAQSTHMRRRFDDLELSASSTVQTFAADSYRQMPCHGPCWFAAGDAASAWDPLSGQGIEKALQSGLRTARAVDGILRGGDAAAVLADYAAREDALDEQYRRHRHAYYAQVRRWPDARFWRRRADATDA
jgi:2-polyprenyl-6-methoxyphenol hydroxylase-like FAD-dependent oxidoreductase